MVGLEAKGYCLWLMPEGDAAQQLAVWIHRLAARHGTETLPPHVTLVSGLRLPEWDAVALSARAAPAIRPLTVALGGVEGRDEHFRCLFLRAKDDGSLRAAHAIAAHTFGCEPEADFQPHLSLVYGTLTPREKDAVAREVGRPDIRFEARRLHLWRTEGSVADWRELRAFELGCPSDSD
jgi:2'-5' RNA ligase